MHAVRARACTVVVSYSIMHNFCPQTSHKKTFFYLEQLILKHNAHQKTVKVKQESGKLYFKFSNHEFIFCLPFSFFFLNG